MRLGLFGGTFDPIHLGHLILAEQCREACGLERVWFVVAGEPPHKRGPARTPVAHRLEMARLAVAGHSAFEVSDIEAVRPGPHYSVETLAEVQRLRPADDLFFLIGADSLVDLPTWREPDRITQLATIVVVNRPGVEELGDRPLPEFGPDSKPLQHVTIPPSASPPTTCAAVSPKAGASAIWSPARFKPILTRINSIGQYFERRMFVLWNILLIV
ncbi:nicotinate (nicotinamide) nucleotide adenylyltransferase [Paludisphaera borealis]|uniref:Probable nicotinate-nucleotide adenylyltransferase n=1 Tax=Paludisphaera borealis TaxID=1387353 RepID=A0A1U7CTC6_9BACT|nr:nicotinate (nicotinamide) nucleotide adenylyltransferase [Paludisphaera borealis]APW62156.1 Nicotinate-nucleotide adenylyltransferase [Paludisphaera borealis]